MRIKRGKTKNRKHKKVLKLAKGYRLSYSKLYKRAKEALLHAGQYNFNHRKKRAGKFRRDWIRRINAGLENEDLSYSKFIGQLGKNNIKINRKVLSIFANDYPDLFKAVVQKAK